MGNIDCILNRIKTIVVYSQIKSILSIIMLYRSVAVEQKSNITSHGRFPCAPQKLRIVRSTFLGRGEIVM